MKKYIGVMILAFLITGCNNQEPAEQLDHLNGYWEIERVEFSEDSIREFKINENVDFIEIKDGTGFRKKVRPQFDGTYTVTNDAEKVVAKIEEGKLNLYYTTPFDSWKETVIKAEEDKLSLKNDRGIIYHYKRFTPLLSDYDEKK
jgi:hypothetical protein